MPFTFKWYPDSHYSFHFLHHYYYLLRYHQQFNNQTEVFAISQYPTITTILNYNHLLSNPNRRLKSNPVLCIVVEAFLYSKACNPYNAEVGPYFLPLVLTTTFTTLQQQRLSYSGSCKKHCQGLHTCIAHESESLYRAFYGSSLLHVCLLPSPNLQVNLITAIFELRLYRIGYICALFDAH